MPRPTIKYTEKENSWGVLYYFHEGTRDLKKIYCENLGRNLDIDEIESCLKGGMSIYTESNLNALIRDLGFSCDQAETGNGFATFKKITY